ncbi:MAG TPA: methyltransferase domain-containing protein [Candidatus Acidoferrum sp.]|nr:methyltransferase domain-containing protein [Candidatus Acidoferrum sp.]
MTLERVREHFEHEAREFDGLIVRLIPRYDEMIDAMIAAIPFSPDRAIRVLDLGCGTGTVALRVKQRFPHARITCLDLAENMLALARAKLAACDGMEFEQGDFLTHPLNGPYDAAVSSLALHHLETDADKAAFYRRLYAALAPGAVFWTADAALGATPALNQMYMGKWKDHMRLTVPEREIEERWFTKHADEDHPAPLRDHFRWMEAAGFVAPEIVWRYFYCGVYGAHKPA